MTTIWFTDLKICFSFCLAALFRLKAAYDFYLGLLNWTEKKSTFVLSRSSFHSVDKTTQPSLCGGFNFQVLSDSLTVSLLQWHIYFNKNNKKVSESRNFSWSLVALCQHPISIFFYQIWLISFFILI